MTDPLKPALEFVEATLSRLIEEGNTDAQSALDCIRPILLAHMTRGTTAAIRTESAPRVKPEPTEHWTREDGTWHASALGQRLFVHQVGDAYEASTFPEEADREHAHRSHHRTLRGAKLAAERAARRHARIWGE